MSKLVRQLTENSATLANYVINVASQAIGMLPWIGGHDRVQFDDYYGGFELRDPYLLAYSQSPNDGQQLYTIFYKHDAVGEQIKGIKVGPTIDELTWNLEKDAYRLSHTIRQLCMDQLI